MENTESLLPDTTTNKRGRGRPLLSTSGFSWQSTEGGHGFYLCNRCDCLVIGPLVKTHRCHLLPKKDKRHRIAYKNRCLTVAQRPETEITKVAKPRVRGGRRRRRFLYDCLQCKRPIFKNTENLHLCLQPVARHAEEALVLL